MVKIFLRLILIIIVFVLFFKGTSIAGGITLFLCLLFELLLHLHNMEQKKNMTEQERIHRLIDVCKSKRGLERLCPLSKETSLVFYQAIDQLEQEEGSNPMGNIAEETSGIYLPKEYWYDFIKKYCSLPAKDRRNNRDNIINELKVYSDN